MKLEVGKTYVLNNGEKHVCDYIQGHDISAVDQYGFGPFIIDGMCYHQDGKFCDNDAEHSFSVSHEYTQPEGKTLAELDVKAPTLWRYMTDAEKGALLLAYYEGKEIESSPDGFKTVGQGLPVWYDGYAYRIKATPKVVTVTGWRNGNNFHNSGNYGDRTHRITFNTIDGEPDTASIKMDKL